MGTVALQGHRTAGRSVRCSRQSLHAVTEGLLGQKGAAGRRLLGRDGRPHPRCSRSDRSLLAREFPDFNPYPWGPQKWAARLLRHILISEALIPEFAEPFAESHPLRRANSPGHSAGSHVPGASDWSRRSASNSPKSDARPSPPPLHHDQAHPAWEVPIRLPHRRFARPRGDCGPAGISPRA